jgi:hypothetical protein
MLQKTREWNNFSTLVMVIIVLKNYYIDIILLLLLLYIMQCIYTYIPERVYGFKESLLL